MRPRSPQTSRHLRFVFVAVLVPAAAILVFLGIRLLQLDRVVFRQQETERHAVAADAVARALSQTLSGAEQKLAEGIPADGTLLVRRTSAGIDVAPAALVAWIPDAPPLPNAPDAPFRPIEVLEFRGHANDALAQYRRLERHSNPGVRAGALLRGARVLRNSARLEDALTEYAQLARIDDVGFDGTPADLVARRATCDLLQQLGRRDALAKAAQELETDFERSRWMLDRGTWELVADDLKRWTSTAVTIPAERVALSEAIESIARDSAQNTDARFVLAQGKTRTTVVWRVGRSTALLIPAGVLNAWLRATSTAFPPGTMTVSLIDERGDLIAGDAIGSGEPVRRGPSESALPWTILISAGPASSLPKELQSRERLLSSALIALALFLGGGTYLLWRAVQREVEVAHLQTEFVSAVSHEFRTPLTSLRQVVELLQECDVPSDRRAAFYGVMARNTERLHRLIESLLDFGRMEHSRKPYELCPVDLSALTLAVVEEFRVDSACCGRTVVFSATPAGEATVRADAPSLANAIWNLLDNAVKYSPGGEPVRVDVAPHRRGVAIAVTDSGLGIRQAEQRDIFAKFVRGGEALRLGIKGTGVGLAIVKHIMNAHDGEIEVESLQGRGSTFRLVLPDCTV